MINYSYQHISNTIINQIIDNSYQIIKQNTFINRYSNKYSSTITTQSINKFTKILIDGCPLNSNMNKQQQPYNLPYDNLMNAVMVQNDDIYRHNNKQQINSNKTKNSQFYISKSSKSHKNDNNQYYPIKDIVPTQILIQQQKYMDILRKHKSRQQKLQDEIKNSIQNKKIKKIQLKPNDKVLFDYNGKMQLNNNNNKNEISSIASLRNHVPQLINKKITNKVSITTDMRQVTNKDKDTISQKKNSFKFQFNNQEMMDSIQLVDKKIKMWFDGRQITKFQKNQKLDDILSQKNIKNNNNNSKKFNKQAHIQKQINDQQKKQYLQEDILKNEPNNRKQRFLSQMKERNRAMQRIKTDKQQSVQIINNKGTKKKRISHLKTQSITSDVRSNGHSLKIQMPVYLNNMRSEQQLLTFKSIPLSSSKKYKNRQFTSKAQDQSDHISQIRQKFSQIDPKQKLPIIIKKQNRIQTQVFQNLRKQKDVKYTKKYRLLLAQKLLTEASVQWNQSHYKNQK